MSLFGVLCSLLLERYFGQKTITTLKLCLQVLMHLQQSSLYVRLPVLGLMKKSHSCFAFFDNLGIYENLPSLVRTENAKSQGIYEKNIYLLICLNWEKANGHPKRKKISTQFLKLSGDIISDKVLFNCSIISERADHFYSCRRKTVKILVRDNP